jgi:hypothetical protein
MWRVMCRVMAAVILLFTASEVFARPKCDTVWTDRGDQVVCEILQLTQGKLSVSTNDMGTLSIDWLHVSRLSSSYYFRVEPDSGGRFFGSLWLEAPGYVLSVRRFADTLLFVRSDVVAITPIENRFWSRIDGSFALGFSYTKASNVAQLTLTWTNRYTTEKDLVDFNVNTITTATGHEDSVARSDDASITYYRLVKRKLNASGSAAYQRNDELGLRRRGIFTLTGGVIPFRTNLHTLLLSTGVAFNSEIGTADSSVAGQSTEGVVKAKYSLFTYDSPKTSLDVTTAYYPSITTSGRHRFDFSTTFSHELVSDFFVNLSFYSNFDTKPATQDASKSDFGIVTSISWTY